MKSGFRLGNINFIINNSNKNSEDFFTNKRVTLFSIYQNLNSQKTFHQLKNFEYYYDRIKKLGIHDIYCCALNSFEILKNKFESMNIQKIKILPDEKGIFNKHIGMLDLDPNNKLKKINKNYTAIITDGIIEKWWEDNKRSNLEFKKPFLCETSAENCINYLSGTE